MDTAELHGAAIIVYSTLSRQDSSPAEKRAALVKELGHIEQDLFKEAVGLVQLLQARQPRTLSHP